MRCIKPITLRDTKNMQSHIVPCGKCNYCLKARKNDWTFRMSWELREAKTAYFITLTYSPENVPTVTDGKFSYMTLRREDVKRFHNSLRQANDRWYKDQGIEMPDYRLKYYTVGEYGTKTQRPHYHLVIFNLRPEIAERIPKIWHQGHTHEGKVEGASMAYVAKYLIDNDERANNQPIEKPFSIMSKGIGEFYLNKQNRDWHKAIDDAPEDWRYLVINIQGHKQRIPRYYRDQLFTPEERALIGELHQGEEQEKYIKDLATIESASPPRYEQIITSPERQYWERLRAGEKAIKTKSKKSNHL